MIKLVALALPTYVMSYFRHPKRITSKLTCSRQILVELEWGI